MTPPRPAGPTAWPRRCAILLALGLLLLAVPARFEGPALLEVGPGHAISLVDLAGLVPLVLGSRCLHSGLWRRRRALEAWARDRPWPAIALFSTGALGLGLLLASAFSRFFWWWAIGAVIFAGAHVPVVGVASREREADGPEGLPGRGSPPG